MSLSIPKVSAPLAKSIRTGEGILIYLTSVGIAAGTLIDPSALPPTEASIVVGAIAVLHTIARTTLKITALQKNVGIGAPIAPKGLENVVTQVEHDVTSVVPDLGTKAA